MTSAKLDLSGLSRRELQLLAKEFQLCRGNAKSDVIAQHLDEFITANANGERLVLAALGDTTSAGKPSPAKVPSAKPSVAKPSPSKASPAKASPAKASPTKMSAKKPSSTSARATPPVVSPKHNVDDRSESSGDDETGFHPARPAPRRNAQPIAPRANKVSPSKATAVKASLTASGGTPSSERKREEPKTASAASPTTKRKRSELATAKTAGEPSVKKTGASSSKTAEATSERNTVNVSTTKSSPTVIETTKSAPASAVVEDSAKPVSTPAEVTAFVATVDDLEFTKDGRVRCSTTSHEMKADLAVIKEHLNGKRYARARREKKLSLATYAPMFSEHPDEKLASHMVWCNVTESAISRTRQQIEAHITGPRYQKELPRWKEEQAAKAKAEAEEAERLLARKRAIQKRKLDLGNDERKKGDAKRKKANGERKKGKLAAASSTAA